MTKKLAVAALLMFLIITTLIGSTLIKNDFLNPEKEPVVTTTEDKKEEEKKETPKPEVDLETDTRFSDTNSILLLVNKKHKLEETYDIVPVLIKGSYINPVLIVSVRQAQIRPPQKLDIPNYKLA